MKSVNIAKRYGGEMRRHRIVGVVVAVSVLALGRPVSGQGSPANPADVSSVDGVIAALYDVISGGAGVERDWDRFRSLFTANAQLIPTRFAQNRGQFSALSVDDYVANIGPRLEETGFFEIEVSRVMESFGEIAHAFSTYESRRTASDPQPFQRGINSIQLFNDGSRWWVMNIFWASERQGLPIPPKYVGR